MVYVNRLSFNMDRTLVLHCRVPKAPIGECGELFQSLYQSIDFKDGIPLPNGTTINLKEEIVEEEPRTADDDYGLTDAVRIAVDEAIDEVVDEAMSTGFWAQHRWLLIGILVAVLLVAIIVLFGVLKGPVYLKNKFEDFKTEIGAKTTEIVYATMKKLQTQTTEEEEL